MLNRLIRIQNAYFAWHEGNRNSGNDILGPPFGHLLSKSVSSRPSPMRKPRLSLLLLVGVILAVVFLMMNGCGGGGMNQTPAPPPPPRTPPPPAPHLSGVLMWKGDQSGQGLYGQETTLTPANVNATHFGLIGRFNADGLLIAQPLYVANVDTGSGTHNLIIIATEHCSVYAIDADQPSSGSLWERHYLDPANGITAQLDTFGGRSTFNGEVGITGTPVIDAVNGALYFVTMYLHNGVSEQWLRALDIRTGQDFGPGSMQILASVPGDGKGSVNGQIAFDPSIQNQRMGLTKVNGSIIVAWGSFSDKGVYHGWLMAFDASTLKLQAAFNPTPQAQTGDPLNGPSDNGGGAGLWAGGAAPTVDGAGNVYINTADGSFNADTGGNNYGDSLLKLKLNASSFQVVDWFAPANQNCLNFLDLDLGSTGVTLLPTGITSGQKLAVSANKEGRLYLFDTSNLGHFNSGGDRIPQEFMVGTQPCLKSTTTPAADGPSWNRLYGNVAYWNGFVYAAPSNMAMQQYQFAGSSFNPSPVAQSPTAYGWRGGNTVISSNGNQNGIVWTYEKTAPPPSGTGQAILHAYDATSISNELWNSNTTSGEQLGQGIGFSTPVVANGHVIATSDITVTVYGPH